MLFLLGARATRLNNHRQREHGKHHRGGRRKRKIFPPSLGKIVVCFPTYPGQSSSRNGLPKKRPRMAAPRSGAIVTSNNILSLDKLAGEGIQIPPCHCKYRVIMPLHHHQLHPPCDHRREAFPVPPQRPRSSRLSGGPPPHQKLPQRWSGFPRRQETALKNP